MLAEKSKITIATILNAAESLFLSRNYADVTMDQIAHEAHVTKGALYHHFKNKEDLYWELMSRDLREKKRLFIQATNNVVNCRQGLSQLTKAFLKLPQSKRDLIRLIRRDINIFKEPLRSELVKAYQQSLPIIIEEIILRGIQNGELKNSDARMLSWFYVSIVECTLGSYTDRYFKDIDSKLNYILNFFFEGTQNINRSEAKNVSFS